MGESELFAMTVAEEVLKQYRNTPLYHRLAGLFEKLEAHLPDTVGIDPHWIPEREWDEVRYWLLAGRADLVFRKPPEPAEAVQPDWGVPLSDRIPYTSGYE